MKNSITNPEIGTFIRNITGFTHEMTPTHYTVHDGGLWIEVPNDFEIHVSEWERANKQRYYRISLYGVVNNTPCSQRVVSFRMADGTVFDEVNGVRTK